MVNALQPTEAGAPIVSEELLEQIRGGRRAENQLAPLQEQMARADKLRGLNVPQGRQAGSIYQAANPLEFLGAAMQGVGAERKYGGLEAQAQALRGTAQQGQDASLRAKYLRDEELARVKRQVQGRQESKVATSEAKIKNLKPYLNTATGKLQFLGLSDKHGVVDAEGNPTSIEGMEPYRRVPESLIGKMKDRGADSKGIKTIGDLNDARGTVADIADHARTLSPADKEDLSRAAFAVVSEAVTPANVQQYVDTHHKGLSRASKQYLVKVNYLASVIRHKLFGAAQTKLEKRLSDAFSASATGLSFTDRMDRINEIGNAVERQLENRGTELGMRDEVGYATRFRPYEGNDAEPVNEKPPTDMIGKAMGYLGVGEDQPAQPPQQTPPAALSQALTQQAPAPMPQTYQELMKMSAEAQAQLPDEVVMRLYKQFKGQP